METTEYELRASHASNCGRQDVARFESERLMRAAYEGAKLDAAYGTIEVFAREQGSRKWRAYIVSYAAERPAADLRIW